MDILRPVRVFDEFQQRHRALAIPMAVLKKFGDDQAGSLAALVAYYAFFSVLPLLLVFVTILGFVLQGDHTLQQSIEHSVTNQFQGAKSFLNVSALRGNVAVLVLGLLTSLWSGLGVTQAAQNAFDRVWAVPFKDRPDFLHRRLRGLGLLASLGTLFIVATVASGVVTAGLGKSALLTIAGIAFSLLTNIVLFFAAFRFMTARTIKTSCMWIGVITAAIFWEILQVAGGYYIGHAIKHSHAYGAFGIVIGLLVFMHLGAQLTLYAAEINVVLNRKLYPRSLFSPRVPADEKTLRALAEVEQRHESEHIDVTFRR
ncbi:MAG: YihY/virulence factor BrkB family protein [Solirubrobacteraceae bacterium]|nr:YihY/virulence factor BrkB family protein [Actinomycetota bacterium]